MLLSHSVFCFTHQLIVLNTKLAFFLWSPLYQKEKYSSFWLLNINRQWHVFRFPPSQLRWAKDKAAGEDCSLSGSDRGENEDHWEGEEREARWAVPVIATAPDRLQHKHIDTSASVLYWFCFSTQMKYWTFIGNPTQK